MVKERVLYSLSKRLYNVLCGSRWSCLKTQLGLETLRCLESLHDKPEMWVLKQVGTQEAEKKKNAIQLHYGKSRIQSRCVSLMQVQHKITGIPL